jgi:hypothetical protein
MAVQTTGKAVKTWWGAVWRGLVVDGEAKHYRAMRGALWLFVYLVVHADRREGVLYRKYKTIARDMGVSPHTVRGWMGVLRGRGYITATKTGRGLLIHIRKWRPLSRPERAARSRQPE